MYDWANSAFQTTIITAVFPLFFSDVAAAGLPPSVATALFAWATTIAVAVIAVLGPVLGAIADYRGARKTMLGAFVAVGGGATAPVGTRDAGGWAEPAAPSSVAEYTGPGDPVVL